MVAEQRSSARLASDYAELKRRVREAGLLEPDPWFYRLSIAINAVLFVLCFLALARLHEVWAEVVAAAALGLVSGQLGFQLHDAGHHQMFARASANRLVGLLTANLMCGISFAWWVDEHTRHHANPNHMDVDPDVENVVLAYSLEQALGRPALFRLVARYQAFLFVPLACFASLSMQAQGVKYLVRRRFRGRHLEATLLLTHGAAYLSLLVYLLGPGPALLVCAIHQAISGLYMASAVAPNHQGMPQLGGATELDFFRKQVLTARNVNSHWLTDFWFGSLNLQIEHHLFPRMTRLNLRRARPIVKRFCEELGVPYHETSVPQTYRELLVFLHRVGAPLRSPAAPAPAASKSAV
jgi:fatty acid desaturase